MSEDALLPLDRPGSTRRKIYDAALRVFAANGSAGVTVSELAEAAGIARGTIYNSIDAPENLFGTVSTAFSNEMLARTEATMRDVEDPARRIAMGMRLFVRRAHEERDWGQFLARFALSHTALRALLHGPPARDIRNAIAAKRFKVAEAYVPTLVSMLNGATMAAMAAVTRGDQTWRDAGAMSAELFLRAAGLTPAEARRIAHEELPPLSPAQRTSSRANKQKQQ